VEAALAAGARTRDLAPSSEKPLSTAEMGDAVLKHLS
jgi:hypothetical protein